MDTHSFATKTDLNKLRKEVKTEIKSVRQEILRIEEKVENLEDKVNAGFNSLNVKFNNFNVKLDKLQNTMDKFVGTVDDLRTENTVGTHHTRELQIKVDNHEKRLKQIESSKH